MAIVSTEKFVKASPAQVYYAFTHASALHEWLCNLATVAPRPGGRMYLWWHGDYYSSGEYIALEENKSIAFQWFGRGEPAPTQVKVTLKEKSGGTQIALSHDLPEKEFAGRADDFKKEWESALENLVSVLETGKDLRTWNRPMLGININDFSAEIAKALNVPVTEGLRLDTVLEEMGAYKAGLRKDDVLVQLAGKPITNDYGSLVATLQGKKGGDKVGGVFYRGPEKKTVTMELTKRPVPDTPWEPKELAKQVRAKYDTSQAELEKCFQGVSETEAGRQPAPGEWSAKETLAHLIQTERAWLGNVDDLVGGYERISDDWGGNIAAHIQATVIAYPTIKALLDELKSLASEMVAFLAALPPEFVARKSAYFLTAVQVLEVQSHTLSHAEQIKAAVAAARK